MPITFQLVAVARDGTQRTWQAEREHDAKAQTWTYRIRSDGCDEFYEARFNEVKPNLVQPDVLDRHDFVFRGKGLTDAVFTQVVVDTGRTLTSSTNGPHKNFPNESRSSAAERVWRRLFAEERAEYDVTTDRFTYFPQGTRSTGIVRRASASRHPQFYIKGSYVLDVLFGTSYANDIDVCWLGSGGQPTNARVIEWIRLCGLPQKPVQPVRVTDLFACDGGGAPIFNIDLWRLAMDGCVYEMDPATRVATRIRTGGPLRFLDNLQPFALTQSAETKALLGKALQKMQQHKQLDDPNTAEQIRKLRT